MSIQFDMPLGAILGTKVIDVSTYSSLSGDKPFYQLNKLVHLGGGKFAALDDVDNPGIIECLQPEGTDSKIKNFSLVAHKIDAPILGCENLERSIRFVDIE
jgi:hypothetical protein